MAQLLKGAGKRFASGGVFNPSTSLPRTFGLRESFLRKKVEHEVASDPLVNRVKAKQPIRVAVTGGAGQIGYNTLFRLANGEMLGDTPIDLSVLELPFAMEAAQGVKMELQDCAFPLLNSITVTDDAREAFDGCEVALLIGSKPRGPGMERADLLKENGHIFQKIGQVLNEKAERHCRVTVVGNPCNTNCLIAMNNAPDLPVENFSAMTRLDHDRGLSIMARKTMMDIEEVNFFAIWGNHSATMFPDLRNCTIHGASWEELIGYMRAERFYRNEFIPKVQQRGARIIQVRGSSSAASAGNACISHTRDWILGTKREDWVSMAVCSQGEYGVPKGLIFSYPMWCRGGGYEIVSVPKHIDEFSQWQIEENIYELQMERDTVSAYLPN